MTGTFREDVSATSESPRSPPLPIPVTLPAPLAAAAGYGEGSLSRVDLWRHGSLPSHSTTYPVARAADLAYASAPRPAAVAICRKVRLAVEAAGRVRVAQALAARLLNREDRDQQEIWRALAAYGGKRVAAYELEHSATYLANIETLAKELAGEVGLVLSFLPCNLPLYHAVLFVFAPALRARCVVFHPPSDSRPAEVYRKVMAHIRGMLRNIEVDMLLAPPGPSAEMPPLLRAVHMSCPAGRERRPLSLYGIGRMVEDHALFAEGAVRLFGLHDPDGPGPRPEKSLLEHLLDARALARPEVWAAMKACLDTATPTPAIAHATGPRHPALREALVKVLAKMADVTIFTGSSTKARDLRDVIGEESLLLINGSGVNPIVVGPVPGPRLRAVMAQAAEKTAAARLFFSGQDCAAPDAILVAESVADLFLEALARVVDREMAALGCAELPLKSEAKYREALDFIESCRAPGGERNILSTSISHDPATCAISPVIVHQRLSAKRSIKRREFYAPIFYVLTWREGSDDLLRFFADRDHRDHEMCVSIFGDAAWVERHLPRSVKLFGETLLEADLGTAAYGGFGPQSSVAVHGGIARPGPLQVLCEMHAHGGGLHPSLTERGRSAGARGMGPAARERQKKLIVDVLARALEEVLAAERQARATLGCDTSACPRLTAAFFFGPIAGDAFFRPAQVQLGGAGPPPRCPVQAMVVFSAPLEGEAARRLAADLGRRVGGLSGETFGDEDCVLMTSEAEAFEVVQQIRAAGLTWLARLAEGLSAERCQKRRQEARRPMLLLEGLNALAEAKVLGVGGTHVFSRPGLGPPSPLTLVALRARETYQRLQKEIFKALGGRGDLCANTARARRFGHPRDIVFSQAVGDLAVFRARS